jgi:peptide/nickel transport system substrate-binding protein
VIRSRDALVIGILVLALVVLGGAQALLPGAAGPALPSAAPFSPTPPVVYREGVIGRPESITPVTARSRSERTLVGLVFSGLVRLGPGTSLEPDLATSWEMSDDGLTWTFRIRDDARWHDGVPVTAADVAYTVRVLRSPDLAGPAAASWAEVTATAMDEKVVRFSLDRPLAGLLDAATQPLLPAHLLGDVPAQELADHPFSRAPIGTGPFVLTAINDNVATLEPAALLPVPPPEDSDLPVPTDSLASAPAPPTPAAPVPYLDRVEIHFFDDAPSIEEALREGHIDAAAGLPPDEVDALAIDTGAEVVRYPSTTLSLVLLDHRPGHAELREPRVHKALLAAIDRDALVRDALAGAGVRADALVPPGSWAFDAAAAGTVPHDAEAAAALLEAAGWTMEDGGWTAPKAQSPYVLEVLAPPASANPAASAMAAGVVAAWDKLGFEVRFVELEPVDLVGRLREGAFTAAVVDVSFRLDPDLYPFLASTQVAPRGGNLAGLQDRTLDELLTAARTAGSAETRTVAWRAVLAHMAETMPVLPLAWRSEIVLAKALDGVTPRLIGDVGDRYWDVLAWRLAADR